MRWIRGGSPSGATGAVVDEEAEVLAGGWLNGSSDLDPIHDRVIADLRSHRDLGASRFGAMLATRPSDDALNEVYTDVLDLCCRLRQALDDRIIQ